MSSLPGSLSVSFTQESSCSLTSKNNFYYYLHNITTLYTLIHFKSISYCLLYRVWQQAGFFLTYFCFPLASTLSMYIKKHINLPFHHRRRHPRRAPQQATNSLPNERITFRINSCSLTLNKISCYHFLDDFMYTSDKKKLSKRCILDF